MEKIDIFLEVLGSYVFLFLVCFVLGFFVGRQNSLSKEALKLYVASRVELDLNKEHAYLYLNLKDTPVWVFDVDSNTVKKLDSELSLKYWTQHNLSVDEVVWVKGVLGGVVASETKTVIGKVFASSKQQLPNTLKQVLKKVITILSGYYIGDYVGSVFARNTVGERLVPILEDANAGKDIEKLVLMQLYIKCKTALRAESACQEALLRSNSRNRPGTDTFGMTMGNRPWGRLQFRG